MSSSVDFSFATRPLVPYAHDYRHGDSEPWHYHNCAQLVHTLSGVVRIETDLGHWIVPPGRGVWLPAGVPHALQMTGNVAARTLFVDPLARADLPASCQVVQVSPLLRELIVSALALPESYAPASRAERIYELILDEIRVMTELPFSLPEPLSEALVSLCNALRAEPGESWTLENSARRINVSSRTLARRFYQETGLQFSDWVRRARLMEALARLAQGDSVLTVSLELGYESQSAFSAMFRRIMGVAPSDYFPPAN
ncbi:helix-turn-helix domain-containing protein [Erwinia sp. JUb26]|uniref:AraC family transcriptional regulator n=1 Tax=Erwinia sp. JUb26 TaxID=2485126 RepID=UPI000F49887B|nr:helix-turn-helix transcriptional regulator [Erwinia sp. JUb26]ROR13654.1 AraC-like DNA-binding protein [Erwinia sp. JUb26]